MMNHKYGNFVVGTLIQRSEATTVDSKLYQRLKEANLLPAVQESNYGRHVWIKMDEKMKAPTPVY